MECNVSYHWTYLDYLYPDFKNDNWGPTARAAIEIWVEVPTAKGNTELRGEYEHVRIPLSGTMNPKEEILSAIESFAKEHSITIEMDCLTRKYNSFIEPF